MIDKEKDIDYILEKELAPDRYCYIHNFIVGKNKEIERLNNIINDINNWINENTFAGCFVDKMILDEDADLSELISIVDMAKKVNNEQNR